MRNNGYIFASNVVIFVSENVNIEEANSKIYLLDEAQLIQGEGVTGNSGAGELSVCQSGNTNNFSYNYWCSPVGNPSALFGNEPNRVNLIDEATHTITLEDPAGLTSSIDAQFTSDYNGTTSPLTISRRWLYTYVTSDEYSEWSAINEATPILPGLGFTMKGIVGGDQLYDFRGKPNNGTIRNDIAANQITLIGNPYPSAIDAMLFIHDADNTNVNNAPELSPTMTGALYFWEQQPTSHFTRDYIGGYAAYTISNTGMETFAPAAFSAYDDFGNPVPLPPGGKDEGDNVAKRYIPIGQGFMVEGNATTPVNAKVFVKNTHRVFEKISDGNSEFFRSNKTQSADNIAEKRNETATYNEHGLNIIPADHKRFRLNVIFNDRFTRQLVHNFHETAAEGFDYGLEAKNFSDASTDATWILDGEPYQIQAHRFDTSLKIPVVITAETYQPLSFSIFDVQNFDTSLPIYLHDIETDLYVDLNQQNYELNIPEGVYTSRFEITFEKNTLSLSNSVVENFDIFQNQISDELTVLNPNSADIKNVNLFDVTGKQIFKFQTKAIENSYHFSTSVLTSGIYVAKITLASNQSISKKVIIK